MPPPNPQVALYSQNTFDVANPDQQQLAAMTAAATDLNQSGFGTIILGQFHIHDDGTIYYNNSPFDTTTKALQAFIPAIRKGGIKVFLTFGASQDDFDHIASNLQTFKQTIDQFISQTKIDGLDWDYEGPNYASADADLLVDLTSWANSLGLEVTAAPYYTPEINFWTGLLKRTNTGGSNGFSWWNLQVYSGMCDYPSWVGYLKGLVPNPQVFLVPGYSVAFGSTPPDVQSDLSTLKKSYSGLNGGFIWQYEDMGKNGFTAAQFAAAISAGIS